MRDYEEDLKVSKAMQGSLLKDKEGTIRFVNNIVGAAVDVLPYWLEEYSKLQAENQRLRADFMGVLERSKMAWETSKDKSLGLLPEAYLTICGHLSRLKGE